MSVFAAPEFLNHEQVVFACDDTVGLKAIFAIHSTKKGPALGGCRMWPYESEAVALTDVLRLSKAMTYKAVMAGLELGGGKVVMIGDSKRDKTTALLQAMGTAVDRLQGRFIIAEDIGTTVADTAEFRKTTRYVVGLPEALGGSGDPSPTTAKGCLLGLQACALHVWKQKDLAGVRVAIQGLGNVGWNLARLLNHAGAEITVSDVNSEATDRAEKDLGASVVSPDAIYEVEADVFAPCAMGAILNDETIPKLKAKIVGGAANNQLLSLEHAECLRNRGILYAPDYVINAAGMIRVTSERDGFDQSWVDRKISNISNTLLEVFEAADRQDVSTEAASRMIAEDRLTA